MCNVGCKVQTSRTKFIDDVSCQMYMSEALVQLRTNIIYSHDKMCFIYSGLFESRAFSIFLSQSERKLLDRLFNFLFKYIKGKLYCIFARQSFIEKHCFPPKLLGGCVDL